MGNIHLVTGYAGKEHITAVDQGAFNAALIGTGQFVLDKGNVFGVQVISNNQIRVLDGELMMQGRFVRLDPGTYVDLTIENGAQGYYRNDLIAARYTKDIATGVESVNLVIIKGDAATSSPVDPAHTTGDIASGSATMHDFPLWRIPLTGIAVGTPEALFGEPFMDSMLTLPDIRRKVNEIHSEVDAQLSDQDEKIAQKIAGIESYTKEETLDDATKLALGMGSSAVPKDAFAAMNENIGGRAKIAIGSYVGTGEYGSSNPCNLTFDFVPKIVVVMPEDWSEHTYAACQRLIAINGAKKIKHATAEGLNGEYFVNCAWEGNTFSWYTTDAENGEGIGQYNKSGATYLYVAIG